MIPVRGALSGALLALLAALPRADARGQDPVPPPAEVPIAPVAQVTAHPAPVLDFTKPFDHAAYEAALGALVEAFPELMRVRSLGKSRGGRDLWLAVLADTGGEEPRKHPAAVVVPDLRDAPSGATAGPEASIFVLESLLARARDDAPFRERLRSSALYFLPAPDPDHTFAPAEARACRLDENFPARWLPFGTEVHAPGPYALSEPESLTLARFLLERENLSTLLVLSRGDEGSDPTRATSPGSLRAYARETLDLALVEARPWTGAAQATPIGEAPAGFEAAAAQARSVLDALPRLVCGTPKLERLRPDLWLLDLPLRNEGSLPTLGDDSRRPGIPSVSMRVSGGRLVACALREAGSESFEALADGPELVPLGHLDGQGAEDVRIVVQADEGTNLSVSFSSSRAGTGLVGATLR